MTPPALPSCATASCRSGAAPESFRVSRKSSPKSRSTGSFGIGHTRWATHGRPTEENAHPHRDCKNRIVVVHNGIIENYLELKRELRGRRPHVRHRNGHGDRRAPGREGDARGDGLAAAVRRALARLRGLFALVLISADDPDTIVAVRNGPPVVIGLGKDEYFVASDIPAILEHTRDVVFLDDREMAIVTRSGRDVLGFRRAIPSRKTPRHVTWDPVMAEKAGYRPLHAQGDLRAAVGRARDRARPRCRSSGRSVFLDEMQHRRADARGDRARRRFSRAARPGTRAWSASSSSRSWRACRSEVDYSSEFRYRRPIVDAIGRSRSRSRSRARRPTRSARCARPSSAARAAWRSATSSAAWPRARRTAPSTRTPARRSASPRRRRSRHNWWRCTCSPSISARSAARSRRTQARVLLSELDALP